MKKATIVVAVVLLVTGCSSKAAAPAAPSSTPAGTTRTQGASGSPTFDDAFRELNAGGLNLVAIKKDPTSTGSAFGHVDTPDGIVVAVSVFPSLEAANASAATLEPSEHTEPFVCGQFGIVIGGDPGDGPEVRRLADKAKAAFKTAGRC